MIQQLSWSLTNLLLRREVFEEEDSEIYAFGFECLIADTLQYIIFFVVALLLRQLLSMAVLVAAILCIKQHIGGWHANTHWLCLTVSTLSTVGVLFLCNALPWQMGLVLLGAGAVLIFMFAPVQHVSNPKTEAEVARHRKTARLFTLAETAAYGLLLISPFQAYAIYIAGGLFLSAVSLLFPSMAVHDAE